MCRAIDLLPKVSSKCVSSNRNSSSSPPLPIVTKSLRIIYVFSCSLFYAFYQVFFHQSNIHKTFLKKIICLHSTALTANQTRFFLALILKVIFCSFFSGIFFFSFPYFIKRWWDILLLKFSDKQKRNKTKQKVWVTRCD